MTRTSIALVIAHPDDEVMFFGPTLAELTRPEHGNIVRVLCMSSGNHDGLGETRKKELVASCKSFGIRETHVTILEREELKDGPNELWDPSLVGDQMNLFAKKHNIETLITFDEKGVSAHTNHIACYVGLTYFIQTFKERTPVKTCYVLKSVSLLRKYISLLDLPMTMLMTESLMPLMSGWMSLGGAAPLAGGSNRVNNRSLSRPLELLFVSSPKAIFQAKRAMEKHESQMVWFRKLYVIFSRYMSINELRRVM
ncbi:putative deacetylase LmbE-like domain-containing protein [Gamsiella multidivaricata]|uniref:putative deacetylase LmbE-like domain-containing protein n=1 Tax=Gamsiella multidivaricata TaxID=101098 RepID=UPI00221F08EC|nr:putative deacetylase LmbE-like domain-containing protein [Gamsiella multidivaricata]KAI7823541.1 putative deacetylase LmbE-like domain-containing protein [Gamsiella multidivaricata]